MHKHERGMSFWPFVVTLILLLIFIFMWFSAKSDTDDNVKLRVAAETAQKNKAEEATALAFYIERLAKVVGWQDSKAPIEVKDEKGTVVFKYEKPVPNVAEIEKALSLETTGGPLASIRDAASVKVASVSYKPNKGVQVPPSAEFQKLAPNLKAKVDEVMRLKPGAFPSKPDDPGDAAAVAKYEADKKAWEEQFKSYSAALEAIVKEPGYEKYSVVLGEASLYDPEKPGVIDWSFWEKPAAAYSSLEEFMGVPAPILRNMRDSYIDRVKNDLSQIDSLTAALADKEKVIDNVEEAKLGLKQQLDKEQQLHSADVARLQAEAQAARDAAEKSRVGQTGAETTLAAERERAKAEAAKLAQTIGAQKNALAGQKERFALDVQRDEPDGALLSADPALGIAYVNLGSQDKLSVGTKFSVWVIGRGGQKVPKGEVVITKVLDSHYSQARIASTALGERPLAPGDMVSNPFYDKRKQIHVYLAGVLKKYPKEIAVARLADMGAVVDNEISDKTDWIVLPDSVTVGEKPAEGAPPDATAPKEESPLARYERLARTFGATLITERVIEAFLDY